MWSAREKFLKVVRHGRELNRGYGDDKNWDTFILPLSYHDRLAFELSTNYLLKLAIEIN